MPHPAVPELATMCAQEHIHHVGQWQFSTCPLPPHHPGHTHLILVFKATCMHCSASCLECGVNFAEVPGSPCQMMNQLVLQREPAQTGWARVEEDRGPPGSIASPSVIHTGPISKSASCMYGARHCHLTSGCMMLGDQAVCTACSSLEQSVARVLEGRQSPMTARPLPKPSGRMTEVSNRPSLYLWVPLCPH